MKTTIFFITIFSIFSLLSYVSVKDRAIIKNENTFSEPLPTIGDSIPKEIDVQWHYLILFEFTAEGVGLLDTSLYYGSLPEKTTEKLFAWNNFLLLKQGFENYGYTFHNKYFSFIKDGKIMRIHCKKCVQERNFI